MRKRLFLLITFPLLLITFLLSSCGDDPRYKANFYDYNNELLQTIEVSSNATAIYTGENPKSYSDEKYTYTFTGWDKSTANVQMDTDFHAVYTKTLNVFSVKYYNGGVLLYDDKVEYGATSSYKGSVPTSTTDKVFIGWDTDLNDIKKDTIANAVYEKRSESDYTVYVDYDNSLIDIINNDDINSYNYVPNRASSDTKDYTFDKWVLVNDGNVYKTYQASYIETPKKIKFTLDVNGGNCEVDSFVVEYGSSYELPIPTRDEYNFLGWYNGETLVESGICSFTENVNLVAKWDIINYSISYEMNGGINNSQNPSIYNSETNNIVLLNPTRTGYTFLGWTTNEITTPTKNLTIIQGTTGNKSFTANWEANTYTITYDVNGGNELAETTQTVVYDSNYTLAIPERIGYSFDGWYYNNNKITNSIWKYTNDYILKAKWIANTNTKYIVNHYLQNIENDNYELDESKELSGTSDSQVTPSVKVYEGFTSPSPKNVTILADGSLVVDYYYTRNYYTVTFISNGGTSVNTISQKYQSTVDNTISSTKENRTFDAWYCDVNLTLKYTDYIISSQNVILYARWEEEIIPANLLFSNFDDEVTIIGNSFTGTNLIIPDYIGGKVVTAISESAFMNLTNVTNIVVPNSIETIGANAFSGCSFVSEVTLGNSVVSIGDYAFAECSLMERFNASTLYKFAIPASCAEIGEYAFKGMALITDVTIPNSVESIGLGAFNGFNSLENITLPFVGKSNDAQYNEAVFGYIFGYTTCNAYSYGYIWDGSSKTYLGNEASNKYKSSTFMDFTNYIVSNSSTAIYSPANTIWQYSCYNYKSSSNYYLQSYFYYVPSLLTTVTITNGNTIPDGAFNGCSNVVKILTSDTIDLIGESAFQNCVNLKQLNSSNSGEFIVPSGIAGIPAYAFYGCSSVESITLPSDVAFINSFAFAGCNLMQHFNSSTMYKFEIPLACTEIGEYAFKDMALITDVTVPDDVESIGLGAFNGFNSLESITLPFVGKSDDAKYDKAVFGYIFGYTTKLQYYKGSASATYNTDYYKYSKDFVNVQYGNDSMAIWMYTCKDEYQVCGRGSSVSGYYNIGGYAGNSYFYYVPTTLRSITITMDFTIPIAAFNNLNFVENIHLINCIDSVGDYAFQNCNAAIDYLINPVRSSAWDGSLVSNSYHGGTGSQNDPYQIFSPKEFIFFLNQVRNGESYEGVYFVLTSNINLGGFAIDPTSLSETTAFNGVLDGNSYKVYNFRITSADNTYNGLFNYMNGTIKNIGFETSMTITTTLNTDVYIGLIVGKLNGVLENVYVSGSLTSTSSRNSYVGGFVGNNSGTILNSYSNVTVNAKSTNLKCYAAGLVGYNDGALTGSFAYGNVSAKGYVESYSYASGLVSYEGNNSDVISCYRYNGQEITKFDSISNSYNTIGTEATLEEIILYCKSNWDSNVWSYDSELPL